jgi:serine/threonine-protein kinase/endoribonuclease IRE1
LELETGKVKATINSQCPWDPFADPFEDLKDSEDEIDLEELERIKPPKPEKPTEIFIGRTGVFSLLNKKLPSIDY